MGGKMTLQTEIEMTKLEYETKLRKLQDLLDDRNSRLNGIQDIYNKLNEHYDDTIGDVNYIHSEIDDQKHGWLYRINELSYIK
jgi:hypothetical protein